MSIEASLWKQLDEVLIRKQAQEDLVRELQAKLAVEDTLETRLAIREAKEPLFQICRDHSLLARALTGKARPA